MNAIIIMISNFFSNIKTFFTTHIGNELRNATAPTPGFPGPQGIMGAPGPGADFLYKEWQRVKGYEGSVEEFISWFKTKTVEVEPFFVKLEKEFKSINPEGDMKAFLVWLKTKLTTIEDELQKTKEKKE